MPKCNHNYLYVASTNVYNGKLKYQCYYCKKTKTQIKDIKLYFSFVFIDLKNNIVQWFNNKRNKYVLF